MQHKCLVLLVVDTGGFIVLIDFTVGHPLQRQVPRLSHSEGRTSDVHEDSRLLQNLLESEKGMAAAPGYLHQEVQASPFSDRTAVMQPVQPSVMSADVMVAPSPNRQSYFQSSSRRYGATPHACT